MLIFTFKKKQIIFNYNNYKFDRENKNINFVHK